MCMGGTRRRCARSAARDQRGQTGVFLERETREEFIKLGRSQITVI